MGTRLCLGRSFIPCRKVPVRRWPRIGGRWSIGRRLSREPRLSSRRSRSIAHADLARMGLAWSCRVGCHGRRTVWLLVERCLANQSRYGEYDTSALCLLLLRRPCGEGESKHKSRCSPSRIATQLQLLPHRSSMADPHDSKSTRGLTRRDVLLAAAAGVVHWDRTVSCVPKRYFRMPQQAQIFRRQGRRLPDWILPMSSSGGFENWASFRRN